MKKKSRTIQALCLLIKFNQIKLFPNQPIIMGTSKNQVFSLIEK